MHEKEKAFTFFLTGKEDNDTAAENYVRTHGYDGAKCIQYRLEYTPPYRNFTGISYFERMTQYHPFDDPIQKKAVAIIDLSEWIGHEKEQYLEIFCKFLHDYDWSFYRYEYVFTVGKVGRIKIKALYALVDEYLCEGEIEEDRTLIDEKKMSQYLSARFAVDRTLAARLSHILVSDKIKGFSQLNTVIEDFVGRMRRREGSVLSEKRVERMFDHLKNSKLATLFEKDLLDWGEEYVKKSNKEEAV